MNQPIAEEHMSVSILLVGQTRKAFYHAEEPEHICTREDLVVFTNDLKTIEEIKVTLYDDRYESPFLEDLWLLMRGTPDEIDQHIRTDCPAATYNASRLYPTLSKYSFSQHANICYPCFEQPHPYFARTRQNKILISSLGFIVSDMYGIDQDELVVLQAPSIKGDDN